MVQIKREINFLGDLFGPLFTIIHHLMLVESHGNLKKREWDLFGLP